MRLPWGLRWWELAPEAVLVIGLGWFAATETSAATSAFKSTTAVALMAVTLVAWVGARYVLARWVHVPAVRTAVFGVGALAILAIVVLPAYRDTTVVETFPTAAAGQVGSSADAAMPTTTTATTTAPPPPGSTPVEPPPSSVPPSETPTTTAAPASEPVALRSADIYGIGHRASGTVVLYRQPDGSYVVGLEGIDIQPGPDYDLYLVPGADRSSPGDGVRLDDLRGNKGTQYYGVPPGHDLEAGTWTVLVWCETFDVPVAAASA